MRVKLYNRNFEVALRITGNKSGKAEVAPSYASSAFLRRCSLHRAERYYIHVKEQHVTAGFERFVSYLERRLGDAVPAVSSSAR